MTVGGVSNLSHLSSLLAIQKLRAMAAVSPARAVSGATPVAHPAAIVATQELRSTLAYLDAQSSAAQRGIAVVSTADASLGQISDLLVEGKTLVIAVANDSGMSVDEKQAGQLQLDAIVQTIDRIASSSQFAGEKLLDGNYTLSVAGASLTFSAVSGDELSLTELTSGGSANLVSGDLSDAAAKMETAIDSLATTRARMGAFSRDTLQTTLTLAGESRVQVLSAASSLTSVTNAAQSASDLRATMLASAISLLDSLSNTSSGTVLWLVNPAISPR